MRCNIEILVLELLLLYLFRLFYYFEGKRNNDLFRMYEQNWNRIYRLHVMGRLRKYLS